MVVQLPCRPSGQTATDEVEDGGADVALPRQPPYQPTAATGNRDVDAFPGWAGDVIYLDAEETSAGYCNEGERGQIVGAGVLFGASLVLAFN